MSSVVSTLQREVITGRQCFIFLYDIIMKNDDDGDIDASMLEKIKGQEHVSHKVSSTPLLRLLIGMLSFLLEDFLLILSQQILSGLADRLLLQSHN